MRRDSRGSPKFVHTDFEAIQVKKNNKCVSVGNFQRIMAVKLEVSEDGKVV